MFLEVAQVFAKRSICFRGNLGAVVVHERRIVSHGYNGPAAGEAHCFGHECPLTTNGGCLRSVHAEKNALDRMPDYLSNSPLAMYCTQSPCEACTNEILKWPNITELAFLQTYRIHSHLEKFRGKAKVLRVLPSGITIDHFENTILEPEDS